MINPTSYFFVQKADPNGMFICHGEEKAEKKNPIENAQKSGKNKG